MAAWSRRSPGTTTSGATRTAASSWPARSWRAPEHRGVAVVSFSKASVRDADVARRRVLVRLDFTVPLDGGVGADDMRIRAALPTIELLRERGAALVLVAHLGRPQGKVEAALSMEAAAKRRGELLGIEVRQASGVIEGEVDLHCGALGPGDVMLLENVRFEPGETEHKPN